MATEHVLWGDYYSWPFIEQAPLFSVNAQKMQFLQILR